MAAPLEMVAPRPVRLWDPVVRLTHWAIAAVVLLNAVMTRGGSALHVWIGWIGLSVLVLRLIWGLVGPREARFSAFPPNPVAALRHLGQLAAGRPPHYPSHNPAGAIMVYALWATLAVLVASGLYMTGGATPMRVADDEAAVASGDWSALVREGDGEEGAGEGGEDREGASKWVEEVHEVAGNLILFLVVAHLAGVAIESRAMRRNLVKPMLFGARE